MKIPVRICSLSVPHVAACMLSIPAAAAQGAERDYPSRHIRMVAPFSGGSTLDITARLLADQLGARLGHNVVVNKMWFPARTPQARIVKAAGLQPQ
jgi:putative tricarboxylic transport membrane protein